MTSQHLPHRQLRSMLKVGLIGFGGGSALIPIMERELVSPNGGLTEASFVQDTVVANITPGALPVKIAALSGIQLGGPALAIASGLAVALPGAAATVGLLAFFTFLGDGAVSVIEYASLGITAFILFLLAHYVSRVLRAGGERRTAYAVIAVIAYLLTGANKTVELVADILRIDATVHPPELSALGLILLAIALIAAYSVVQRLRAAPTAAADDEHPTARPRGAAIAIVASVVLTGAAIALAAVAGSGSLIGLIAFSTLSSFGGGEAYVGVADGFFVAAGLVDPAVFYGQIVPLANALPGPILVKIAAGIAYVVGVGAGGPVVGAALAIAAFCTTVGLCCAVAIAVLAGYDRARNSLFVRNLGRYILPVICGLLASTAVSMLHSNARIGDEAGVAPWATVLVSIVVAAAVGVVHLRTRVPDIIIIVVCGAASLAVLSVLAAV